MKPFFKEPGGLEAKPDFSVVPPDFCRKIEDLLQSPISSALTARGGYSPAAGFILTLKNGRRIFAKGSHPGDVSHGTMNLRQEIAVYQNIPLLQDISPRYLGMAEDGDEDGWMLGFWQAVENRKQALAADMIELLPRFEKVRELPALGTAADHNYMRHFVTDEKKWQRVAEDEKIRRGLQPLFQDAGWLDKNLPKLISLQARVPDVRKESCLVHGDLRTDNFIRGDRTYVIDWANACRGPLGLDAAFLFAHLEGMGQCRFEEAAETYRTAGGRASEETLLVFMASLSGYFAEQAWRAVPAGLPRLRWMQKTMLAGALSILGRLGTLDSPPIILDSTG